VADYVLKPIKPDELREAALRCLGRLESAPDDALETRSAAARLIAYIDNSFTSPLSIDSLAAAFHFSPKYISSLIKQATGKSFTDYLTDIRLAKAALLLRATALSVGEIAAAVGYQDPHYFHRIFKRKMDLTPAQYRESV
jgi:YesN/AraC family two-component response regulator